jgi:ribosomal protein L11 methyltransferase
MFVYTLIKFDITQKEIILALISDIEMIEGIEEKETEIEAYADDTTDFESQLKEIQNVIPFEYTKVELQQKNWNEIWESNFEPVIINEKIGIRAVFHPTINNVIQEIIIQPKMSFGTGHHATTAQVIKSMQLYNFKNKKVLDLGSGTAILAIYAEMLGANEVLAIDNDEWCFENAQENIALNHTKHVEPKLGNLEDILEEQYDVVLANIHKNYHLEHIVDYDKILKNGAYILLSGFYENDAQEILNKALEYNLIANYYTAQDNWVCMVLQKNN